MIRRFVDTYYYLALLNPRDSHHNRVVAFHVELTGKTITTEAVFVELCNALAATSLRSKAVELIRIERSSPDVSIVSFDSKLFDQSLELYASRHDKHWSLTDCLSFVVMRDNNISEALTADRHFIQAGYRALFCD